MEKSRSICGPFTICRQKPEFLDEIFNGTAYFSEKVAGKMEILRGVPFLPFRPDRNDRKQTHVRPTPIGVLSCAFR